MFAPILKTLIIYFVLVISMRIMGKRQVGDLQPGELIVTVLISELAAIPIDDETASIFDAVIPIAVLVALEFFTSKIVLKSVFARKVMNGHSAAVIRDGTVDQKKLKKLRLSIDDLLELLRGQNVFDVSTVAYGLLETNGSLSVLLKAENQPVTNLDLSLNPDSATMPIPVITDGIIRKDELEFSHISVDEIEKILKKHRLKLNEVFFMTVDQNKNVVIIEKDKK